MSPYKSPPKTTLRGVSMAAMLTAANGLEMSTDTRRAIHVHNNDYRVPTPFALPESTCRRYSVPRFVSVTPTPTSDYGPGSSTAARKPGINLPTASPVSLNPDTEQAALSKHDAAARRRQQIYDLGADAVNLVAGRIRDVVIEHAYRAAPGVLRRARRGGVNAARQGA